MALVQQILEAIDGKYLSTLRNCITGQYLSDIRSLILHLFQMCRSITPQQLRARYDNVKKMEYSLEDPIEIVFDVVKNLVKIE